jgi:DNA polymerase-3 subunit epsilon
MNLPDFAAFIERPIAFLDIEGTGTDVAKDRIVSMHVARIDPSGVVEAENWMFNPGVQMSAEVIAIHGITNEQVAGCLPFRDHAKGIHNFIKGCDLGGFNLLNYDVPLLWEEFHRAGIKWNTRGVAIIDVGNIFKKKEERTLSAAVKFYCGRQHTGAHGAEADVEATIDVLDAQLGRYQDLTGMSVEELARFSQFEDRIDLAGKIIRNADGVPVFNFGQHKGTRVMDNKSYAQWMLSKDFSENTKEAIRSLIYPQRELV